MPSKPPFIIPIFITHQGCPHRCIFCNQEGITGWIPPESEVRPPGLIGEEISLWLKRAKDVARDVQVAFYGGSFTGIPRQLQESYLGAVAPFLKSGQVQSIRLSTRPDYIEVGTGPFLWDHGVRNVELGVQSLDQKVLLASNRGHSVLDVERAFSFLRQVPLMIGGQLMVGLPGDSTNASLKSAQHLATLAPDFVRIYPTLVLRGSGLAHLYHQGRYHPLSLSKAVALTAKLAEIFAQHHIGVIRMGLQPSADLDANLLDGPHHPAFGELVRSRLFFKKVRKLLSAIVEERKCCLILSPYDRSLFQGQKNYYLNRLRRVSLLEGVEVIFNDQQPRGEATLE